ncbi:hypothetical protein, conserved [Trypanosoma cruzi]|uniref:MMS19 nucleotide excision repair protein n=1 Tax=Trypanosoma cruzi (strain CL Brener) TaxID=353153 RepID=Q4D1A1_TRYCC|nr:hypothetical protein, conserved [Trypanosoma cruzi]EAN86301.1 hypothetical protein, conserved [Trypanosoma cruzi]|eukprot:XP_808152.1 hypothetical protein [Trypanosoma cruzi strain CL Brener]
MSGEKVDDKIERAISMGLNCDEETFEKLRQVPLLQLCRMMSRYLTDEKHIIEALFVLSLATTRRKTLLDEEAVFVLKFFLGKLSSLRTIETSVECITRVIEYLSSQRPCSKIVFTELANGFLPNVRLQALPTRVRRSGFKILKYMVSEATVPWLTTPVLRLLLEAMDEEGEPELVLHTFELYYFLSFFVDKNNIVPLKEQYFDSISSYFPVVFSRPPGCSVTREELKRSLTRCMTCPLYLDPCVSFTLSRLSSPSSFVKQESIAVLLELFSPESGHDMKDLSPHILPVVSHVRNEVIKGVSLGFSEGDSYIRDCINLLSFIGKRSHGVLSPVIASWIEPAISGALTSLNSGSATCSAYATMFYHLARSDASCGTSLLSHFLPLLLMNLNEIDGGKENGFIILSAVFTGILDLCTTDEVHHGLSSTLDDVKRSLELSSPELFRLVETLLLALKMAESSSKIIMCELLSSLLSLDVYLHPWMPVESVQLSYENLLLISLQGNEEIHIKVARCISRIGHLEGNGLNNAIVHLLEKETKFNATGIITLFNALLMSSVPVALLAMELLLNPSRSLVESRLSESDVFSLCRRALSEHADFSEEDILHLLQIVFLKNSPASLEFLCELLVRIPLCSIEKTVLQMVDGKRWSILVIALLSSCDSDVIHVSETLEHWVTEMLNAVREEEFRRVTIQGVSAICAHAPNALEGFLTRSRGLDPEIQLAVHAAAARGLIKAGLAMDDGVESIILRLLDAICSGVDIDEVLTATFFSPSLGSNKCVTLFVPFIQAVRTSNTPVPDKVLKLILQLLGKEAISLEFDWGSILEVCENLARQKPSEGHVIGILQLLDCVLLRIDSKAFFMKRILINDGALFQMLLSAVRSSDLQARCTALRLLSEVAMFAVQLTATNNEDELNYKRIIAREKEGVLHLTQIFLADHKRVVRRAAAQCRHQWYKLR